MPAGTTGRLLDAGATAPRGLGMTAPPLAPMPAAESVTAADAPAAVEAEGYFERTRSIAMGFALVGVLMAAGTLRAPR